MYVHCLRDDLSVLKGRGPQKHHDASTGQTVFFDGQLHNPVELAGKLGMTGYEPSHPAPLEIILAAYQAWGEDCVDHILGEFVFAVIDLETQRVFCARDSIGIKPFFYYLDNKDFVFGSNLSEVAGCEVVPVGLCDEAVAIYLRRGELSHPTLTFHEAIKKLPPGQSFTVSKELAAQRVYWSPGSCPPVELDSMEAYSTRLRELLDDAVRVRLDDSCDMGAHLSGGLDSSTITAIAAPIVLQQGCQMHTFSWMSPPVGPAELDVPEWATGSKVAAEFGTQHHYTELSSDDILHILENHNLADHDSVDLWYEFGVRDKAKRLGVKTILSGWGGDQFITAYGNYRYAETFWRGQPISSMIDLYRGTADKPGRFRRFIPLLFREVVMPVLPSWLSAFWRGRDFYSYDYLAGTTPEFQQFTSNLQKWPSPSPGITVRGQQLDKYEYQHLVNRLESWAVSGERDGIEYRYPLLDRRVVEFALGISADLYRRRGIARYLFRRTVKDILPREVWGPSRHEEPERVLRLVAASSAAVIQWRSRQGDCSTAHPYIDFQRLCRLIDEIEAKEANTDVHYVFKVLTAVKSILVLNMDREKTPPSAGSDPG